jgi:hypothetical protein
MNCSSCNGCNTEFTPLQNTWTRASSLTNSSWQPYPELSAPAREGYDGSNNYLYSLNTCNPSMAGPPTTNGYNYSDRQYPKREDYGPQSTYPMMSPMPNDCDSTKEAIKEYNECAQDSMCQISGLFHLRNSINASRVECENNKEKYEVSSKPVTRYLRSGQEWSVQKSYQT